MRAIKLIINSGTELSKRGILISGKDKGRGATHKTLIDDSSKRKEQSPSTAWWPSIGGSLL